MIRERVTVNDFKRIAIENEYFLWHFLAKDQHKTNLTMWSIFESRCDSDSDSGCNSDDEFNSMDILLSMTNVPYFESYVEDSVDFLINLGLTGKEVYRLRNFHVGPTPQRKWNYVPVVIGFKRTRMVHNTHRTCYCADGVTEVLLKLNPELFSNIE
jgi:hypothetical protein